MVEDIEPLRQRVEDLNLSTEVVWFFVDLHTTEYFLEYGLFPLNESNLGPTDMPFLVQSETAYSDPVQSIYDEWGLNQNMHDGYRGFVLDTQNVDSYYEYFFAYNLIGSYGDMETNQQALIDVLIELDQ